MKVAKETVYLDTEGNTTTDESKAAELLIRKGQEVTADHEAKGVKGVEPAAADKSDQPEAENKSGRKKKEA